MSSLSVRVPTGFSVVLGNLSDFDDEGLLAASAAEIDALHKGEDLATFEHLVLDASVSIDVRGDAFVVSVVHDGSGDEVVEHALSTFGAAIRDLEETLRSIWHLGLPLRSADTAYEVERCEPGSPEGQDAIWIVAGGWTVVADHLSTGMVPPAETEGEPMRLLYAATSSHRSIVVYRVASAGAITYVGLLWAEPVGRLYERVFFDNESSLARWLRVRLRQDVLSRRKKRR